MQTEYKSWPLGLLPKEWQRPEIDQLRARGYDVDDARDAVSIFEQKIAAYAGSKHAVAVDSCTNALFLCLKYVDQPQEITIPARTYCSVPNAIRHAGYQVRHEDIVWSGVYRLEPLEIYDGAPRFTVGMYSGGLHCLSFQIKKHLPIGRGGMILCDDADAARWLRIACHDGRNILTPYDEDEFTDGWHMYMTPEDAARGVLIFEQLPKTNSDMAGWENYTDLRTCKP